jgi:selenocysteine lyase/cysteine desulfurase
MTTPNTHALFQLEPDLIYLNHAAVAPWPIAAAEAVKKFAEENTRTGALHYPRWLAVDARLRSNLARLINAPSHDDIALLKSTSEALSVVAYGLTWKSGDNVVISDQEFPSNRIVWESLADQGVETRRVDLRAAATPEDALIQAMDRRTRVLAISSVQFATGLRMHLDRLGAHCRAHGALFCVDAIQSLGALRFDVQACGADFVAADAHKWMLGPEGVALLYVRAELRERLRLHQFGWHMVEHAGDYTRDDWEPAFTARRFECGSPNMLGIHAFDASVSLLLELGMAEIERRVLASAETLLRELALRPRVELVTDPAPARRAGIVTFLLRGTDPKRLHDHLTARRVFCAARAGGIRFSPHFHTSAEQLARALRAVDEFEDARA